MPQAKAPTRPLPLVPVHQHLIGQSERYGRWVSIIDTAANQDFRELALCGHPRLCRRGVFIPETAIGALLARLSVSPAQVWPDETPDPDGPDRFLTNRRADALVAVASAGPAT